MKFILFFGAEAVIALEEAVVGIPIGEAAWGSVPLIAEHVHVCFIHLDKRVICLWQVCVLKRLI